MAEAWGDVPIRSMPIDRSGDYELSFMHAATSDGEWLIDENQPRDFGSGPSWAVLVRVSDGSVRVMAKLATLRSQILFAASDGPWVVWSEADDEPYFYNWRLMVYNRDTGVAHELARAPHKNGAVLEGPWPVPYVSHDLAVWGQAIGPLIGDDPLKHAVAREADLGTGKLTTLADHAGLPAVSWPWISWEVAEANGTGHIQLTNLESGQQETVDVLSPTFAMQSGVAAYNTLDYQTLCLIHDLAVPGDVRVIMSDPRADIEFMTLNDRIVAFRNQPDLGESATLPTQVYDRELNALVDLPMTAGFSETVAAGPLVTWYDHVPNYDPPRFLQVVDTRDITN